MRRYLLPLLSLFLCATNVTAAGNMEDNIKRALANVFPDMEVTRIRESRIPGLYEVMLGHFHIRKYVGQQYLLKGDLFDLAQRENLSEKERETARVEILSSVPESEYIEFAPEKTEHSIYVFTDITCGYCRLLHNDVPELNNNGVAVRYLAFPRAGAGSPAFRNMESVWCADDPNQALTAAKLGERVKPTKCKNPVGKQFALGQAMGVRGTPAIYLENGRELRGYAPPRELLKMIREN